MDRSSPTKRKLPPTPTNDRPLKQLKPEFGGEDANDMEANGINGGPQGDEIIEYVDEEVLPMANVVSGADTVEWQATIEKVVRNVVSIHFCQTCSFDTDGSISSEATGFVVDAEKGYILTNRVCESDIRLQSGC
jgi:pro-apoptotic serine protease NMA111